MNKELLREGFRRQFLLFGLVGSKEFKDNLRKLMAYDNIKGPEINNDNHPVDSGMEATNDHWGTQLAGDVLPMPGERSMGSGKTSEAAAYATGKAKDPKVKSIGMDTLKGWAGRQN